MKTQAFSLVEVLVSAAILGLLSTSIIGIFVTSNKVAENATDTTARTNLTRNALEAVHAIRNRDFLELEPGSYALAKDFEGEWILVDQPSAPEGELEITIESPATEVRKVAAVVSGDDTVTIETLLTNWRQELRSLGLAVDTTNIQLASRNRELRNIVLRNDGVNEVVIDTIDLSWNRGSAFRRLRTIEQDNTVVWSSFFGVGSQTTVYPAITVPPNTESSLSFTFSQPMNNREFNLVIETSDGEVINSQFES